LLPRRGGLLVEGVDRLVTEVLHAVRQRKPTVAARHDDEGEHTDDARSAALPSARLWLQLGHRPVAAPPPSLAASIKTPMITTTSPTVVARIDPSRELMCSSVR